MPWLEWVTPEGRKPKDPPPPTSHSAGNGEEELITFIARPYTYGKITAEVRSPRLHKFLQSQKCRAYEGPFDSRYMPNDNAGESYLATVKDLARRLSPEELRIHTFECFKLLDPSERSVVQGFIDRLSALDEEAGVGQEAEPIPPEGPAVDPPKGESMPGPSERLENDPVEVLSPEEKAIEGRTLEEVAIEYGNQLCPDDDDDTDPEPASEAVDMAADDDDPADYRWLQKQPDVKKVAGSITNEEYSRPTSAASAIKNTMTRGEYRVKLRSL